MKSVITATAVRRQLKADLIGKDSYRGVTLTYAWLANQFGHFGLGFIPALLVHRLLLRWMTVNQAAARAALAIAGAWLLFEIYNFLGPLLAHRQQPGSKAAPTYTFSPAWRNVAFDTATDVLFFAFGAFSASLFCHWNTGVWIGWLLIVVFLLYPSRYWYLTKMYLQAAQYPFQFRLSQWNLAMDEGQKRVVQQFLNSRDNGRHLLLFGPKGSGKTSLGVAMATELSFQHQPCTYTTGIKLYTRFFEKREGSAPIDSALWDWWSCGTLVIDDINPGEPVKNDLVSPADFLRFVDTYASNPLNREVLARANVIWVLGSESLDGNALHGWKAMLQEMGVAADKIFTLQLRGQA